MQETFLRLWATRERYEPAGSFSAYVFQIGRHFWLNQRKKVGSGTARIPLEQVEAWLAGEADPVVQVFERDRQLRVRQAVGELPERLRAVFELYHFEAMKYGEIAALLGIPEGTVKSRMSEALRRLRRSLEAELGASESGG